MLNWPVIYNEINFEMDHLLSLFVSPPSHDEGPALKDN